MSNKCRMGKAKRAHQMGYGKAQRAHQMGLWHDVNDGYALCPSKELGWNYGDGVFDENDVHVVLWPLNGDVIDGHVVLWSNGDVIDGHALLCPSYVGVYVVVIK